MGSQTPSKQTPPQAPTPPVPKPEVITHEVIIPQVLIAQPQSRYVRKQLIGKGSSTEVYRCIDSKNNVQYAMKVFRINNSNKQQIHKLLQQVKLQISLYNKISHINIAEYQCFNVKPNQEEIEVVMELGKCGTLKQYIEINGPLNQTICAEVGFKILNAITYLHDRNMIHRDLKCSNVILTSQMQPKISDFGLLKGFNNKAKDDIPKLSALLKGTPFYMAPEVIRQAQHNQKADIWSFGCMMIQMLTGKTPWTMMGAEFDQIITYIKTGVQPPLPSNLSKDCNSFLDCCLDPLPSRRLTGFQLLRHQFFQKSGIPYEIRIKMRQSCQSKSRAKIKTGNPSNSTYFSDISPGSQMFHSSFSYDNPGYLRQSNVSEMIMSPISRVSSLKKNSRDYKQNQLCYSLTKRPSQKFICQMDQLDLLENQMNQIFICDQEIKDNKGYVWKRGRKIVSTSPTYRYINQNTPMYSSIIGTNGKYYQLKPSRIYLKNSSSLSESNCNEVMPINTMISRAQRIRYLEQKKILEKQKQIDRRKWEKQLKLGAQSMRREMRGGRYLYYPV